MLTRGLASMLASRLSRWVDLRLASTAVYTVVVSLSSCTANTTGTTCGAPSGPTVASIATGDPANMAAASNSAIGPDYSDCSMHDGGVGSTSTHVRLAVALAGSLSISPGRRLPERRLNRRKSRRESAFELAQPGRWSIVIGVTGTAEDAQPRSPGRPRSEQSREAVLRATSEL